MLNTIKALGIAKKLLELYVNPYKRISLSSILILSDYFLPGKITTKTGNQEQTTNNSQSNRTNIFSRCATSVIILLSINLASLLKFQHSGSLKNIAFPNRNLIGAHNNHPLSPTKNTTFRHVPHNGGSYAKSVENSITKIPSMIMANQRIDIKEQLLMGADIVMLDAAVDKTGDKIESVHSSLKYRKFEDDLKEISTFLQERGNKDRKVAVFIENVNDIKLQQFLDLFNKTGLSEMLPKSKEEWFPEKYKNGGFPSRFFPIIHRNHPIDGIENDKIYPQIAYGKVITTAKELKKCVSEMQNNGLYQLIQPIAMIMTSFEEMFPDQDACPLSCKDLLETIPCVEIINQFGKLPIPAIASSLNSGVEDHAKKCLQTDYNQTLLVALDHTNLN